MGVVSTGQLHDVCDMAEEAARVRGHDLGGWAAVPGEEAVARAATCLRCGRTAYVRSESGLAGAGGAALSEQCPNLSGPGTAERI
jgi:hypothetical protein